MSIAIKVENISKKYRIGNVVGYQTLRDSLTNLFKLPYRLAKAKNLSKNEFWALKDITFQVKEGEVVGIIGPNGAGKTTLLKILTGITEPTNGRALIKGRIGSLLEVGTGFHPELTGRENIFLNGAILGMGKKEIKKKFDQIIEFAGVSKFIDTPMKRYSSGMQVRLAFSVAAHLEPEIMLIDEVLAVGDAEFQKKCLGKMEEVTKESDRTILFVSHNLAAVQNLCKRTIWLDKGQLKMIGKTKEVIDAYLNQNSLSPKTEIAEQTFAEDETKSAQLLKIAIKNHQKELSTQLDMAKPFFLEIDFVIRYEGPYFVWFGLQNNDYQKMITSSTIYDGQINSSYISNPGTYQATIKIDPFLTETDHPYFFIVSINQVLGNRIDYIDNALSFRIINYSGKPYKSLAHGTPDSIILKQCNWQVIKV